MMTGTDADAGRTFACGWCEAQASLEMVRGLYREAAENRESAWNAWRAASAEVESLRARLAESEAGAAVQRAALEACLPFARREGCWAESADADEALASNAGAQTLAAMRTAAAALAACRAACPRPAPSNPFGEPDGAWVEDTLCVMCGQGAGHEDGCVVGAGLAALRAAGVGP